MFKKIEEPQLGLESRLASLEGKHQSSVDARGCAWDADRLQNMITKGIATALEDRRKTNGFEFKESETKLETKLDTKLDTSK